MLVFAANGRARPAALRAYAARPTTSARAARYVLSLPRLTIRPTASPAGDRFRARLAGPSSGRVGWAVRVAQPVLPIPPSEAAYAGGDRHPTVRKNARKAARAGYRCRVMPVDEAVAEHRLAVDEAHIVAVAETADGEKGAITVATPDAGWGLLEGLLKLGEDTPSSVRYLLHLYLMERLRLAGARYLLATVADADHPGLEYFQQVLGFVPTNVFLRPALRGAQMKA